MFFRIYYIKGVPIYTSVLRDKAITNIYIPKSGWRNGYEIHIGNLSFEPLTAEIEIQSPYNFRILNEIKEINIKPEGYEKLRVILEYPESQGKPEKFTIPVTFIIKDKNNPEHIKQVKSFFTFPIN
ncbi:MAG: hypothetical protein KatS3mg129_2664 [Leptospiraceae bacterium]|nr:MAG: hypothetical protein KatS3mg129_2664 [Leptospiraceae bacterium]